MKFTVHNISENEDGSANVILDLDNEAREYLMNYAFIRMLKDAIAEGNLYKAEEDKTDVRTDL
jgi:hypothetical protein